MDHFSSGYSLIILKLTFEQHWFELHGSTYMQIFFSKYYKCIFFTINIFFLTQFTVRIQHMIHKKYKICINWLLLVKLPVSSGLLVLQLMRNQKLTCGFSTAQGVSAPNHHVLKGPVNFINFGYKSFIRHRICKYFLSGYIVFSFS